ncbi:MAG TPA: glycosyltransferase N-terminal domain-containing protein, partial [Acetobacteraceae bacterium]|nr:glycosyltransferase N-terminal domain-containing protein [Acetobacteraceae bacterium]
MSILPALWASGATAAAPALRLLLRQRLRRGREIARRLGEREGLETTSRPPGRLMWLHAASVGESASIIPVLSELARQAPGMAMLVTTGTVSSAGLLVKRAAELGLQDRVAHRFVPLDVPLWVGRFLDHWHPDVAAFVESELWPNLIQGCGERRIPLALLNARISARSYRHWRRAPGFARKVLGEFSVIQAQSDADATRLRELGALRVTVPGNLKFAAPPLPMDAIELARTREWLAGRPCWVAASTHPGEEPIIIEAHRLLSAAHRGLVTILVPRHPDRGGQIARTIEGLAFARRSLGQPPPSTGVWIADTLGELGLWYRVAGIALI